MATYYSTHNAAGGGSGALGSPFTLQELFDAVTSADLGLVRATGTYTPSAKLDLDTNTGSVTARPTIRGCASDGTDDGTVATISGSSLSSSTTLLQIAGGIDLLRIQNLRFTASKNYGIDSNSKGTVFTNVRIDNSVAAGFYQQTLGDLTTFIECEVHNNGGAGYDGPFASRGSCAWIRSSIHNNGSHGIRFAPLAQVIDTLIYKNSGHGIILTLDVSSEEIGAIINSTIASNTGAGISVNSGTSRENILIARTIIYENGEYGIDLNGADADIFTFQNLCVHNNTSGAIDTGSLPSSTITSDPAFANEGAGTENYTPSLAGLKLTYAFPSGIGGTSYGWIGAIQPDTSGSSGGGRSALQALSIPGVAIF